MRHCRKKKPLMVRVRGLSAIMSPQTACAAGDRPALMTEVTNLSLIRQREGSEREIDGETGRGRG